MGERWIATDSNVSNEDFEESRRTLLNTYHAAVQNHVGYLIALIIGFITVPFYAEPFLSSYTIAIYLGIIFLMFLDLLRIFYWSNFLSLAITTSKKRALDHFNKVNLEIGVPYPKSNVAPSTAILQYSIKESLLEAIAQDKSRKRRLAIWVQLFFSHNLPNKKKSEKKGMQVPIPVISKQAN